MLAFASRDALSRFAREHHVSTQQLDELVRAGLLRSIDDAENVGAFNSTIADLLGGFVRRFPIEQIREAFEYVDSGRKIGNVILTLD